MTPPAGAPLDQTTLGATNIYRTEGTSTPALVPDCSTPANLTQFNPCVSSRQYVTINGDTYIQVSVLTTAASHWNSARPKPGAVVVSDSGYTPVTVTTQPGGSVGWKFSGKKAHTVTDSIGLGASGAPLFKSAALTSGSYSFTFPAAGSYPYNSTVKGDSFNGTVAIPATITPSSGSAATNFSVIWATNTPANYVFDIQYRFKPVGATGWKNWASWKTGIAPTHAIFTPNQGAGTYAFHVRLRNTSNGRASLYSPDLAIPES
jgi:plastocyanin